MPSIQDQFVRHTALNPAQSFIVQAPAGSGKTELLTQRYLVLLSHAQKAPEEIVAITFTRKAAGEMRTRILDALAFAHTPEPDKNHYRYTTWQFAKHVLEKDQQSDWSLAKNPNRLRIITIDALATFLCRHTPVLTHFGGQPQICEQATSFYELAAQRCVLNLIQDVQWKTALAQLLEHLDNQVNHLIQLFADLLSRREQWLPHIMHAYAHQETIRHALENSLQRIVLEKIYLVQQHIPAELQQQLWLLARQASEYFIAQEINHPIAACAQWKKHTTASLDHFPAWYGLANLLLTQSGTWRKTVNKNTGFPINDEYKSQMIALLAECQKYPDFHETLCDILIAPPTQYSEPQWQTLSALTQVLPLLSAQLTLVFQEKGQVDFIELTLAALKALGEEDAPTDLALYLDYQIQHLLIDEFQDTSLIHMQLLEKITAGWQSDDGRTLFLVGDPMQSIYRFRNAEVGLFLRTQKNGIGNISLTPLTLTMNFRSQAGLIDYFNTTFYTVFPNTSDIATGRIAYTPAISAKEKIIENSAVFYPLINGGKDDEATQLVQTLQCLRSKHPNDSIAILVRARSQFIPIIAKLHAYQLPFQAIEIEPLATLPAIHDCLSLTRALLHRADRIAWLSILRAPFCGCTLSDCHAIANHDPQKTIWEAITHAEQITHLSQDGLQRLQRCRMHLKNAFHHQTSLFKAQWIEGVWILLGGPATLVDINQLEHVKSFFDLLETLENDTGMIDIKQLTNRCNQLFAKPNHNTNNPIQLMTIHKSKGLEFDHVFLPGLHRSAARDTEKLFRWCDQPNALGGDDLLLAPIKPSGKKNDPIYQYVAMVENKKLDHEITRLLYVAATRAKKTLHCFAIIETQENTPTELKAPKRGSFLEKLWPVIENTAKHVLIQHPFHTSTQFENEKKRSFDRLTTDWHLPKLPNGNHPISARHASATEPNIHIALDLPSQQARITGTVIHEILQKIATHQINEPFTIAQWQSRLLTLGLLPCEIPASLQTIETAIQNTLKDPRGQWILSHNDQDAHCEWTLTLRTEMGYEHLIIDRSFIDENGIRWIIDYKTAIPEENESLNDFLARQKNRYHSQLEKYATMIAQMENRSLRCGLYFPLCSGWIVYENLLSENVAHA